MLTEALLYLFLGRSAGSAGSAGAGYERHQQQCGAGCGQRADTVGVAVADLGGQVVVAAAVVEQSESAVEPALV